ncbi:MAG: D-glycerate dehydrogenase [Myxococcales bacterium]|nr:D-glycerate dehydrogenase [Myxococcales bacterium]
MARVVVSSVLAVDLGPLLPAGTAVIAPGRGSYSRAELLATLAEADALICLLTDRVDSELLAHAPRLRVVANHAVGVDNIDLEACARRGVMVANTPDVLTDATADLTFALLLAAARRLGEGERLVRSGAWRGWEPTQLLGVPVSGQTLGLVGLGRIGAAVARRARGFDMPICYAAPRPVEGAHELGARHVPLDELLAGSDFVSLHGPLTPETRGLIGARELARMKSTAVLINTARGACVDEDALADALTAGRLFAAGLDVFAAEPALSPRLVACDRAVLLPHLGSATHRARARMAELCAAAVTDVLAGRSPTHRVGP